MRVNYFDLGACRGKEISWFLRDVIPNLDVEEYKIYGFEACAVYANNLKQIYKNNDKVRIINKAITASSGSAKLYYSPNGVGHSIYSTKNNVGEQYEIVEGIKFSDWFNTNIEYNERDINVLKVNIEGAEWPLFLDLIENEIHKKIDLFCGQGHDVKKVLELKSKVKEYYKLLEDNNIILHRYSEHRPERNINMLENVKNIMESKNDLARL